MLRPHSPSFPRSTVQLIFSLPSYSQEQKVYVQARIRQQATHVWQTLALKGGYCFIAGAANSMPTDVKVWLRVCCMCMRLFAFMRFDLANKTIKWSPCLYAFSPLHPTLSHRPPCWRSRRKRGGLVNSRRQFGCGLWRGRGAFGSNVGLSKQY